MSSGEWDLRALKALEEEEQKEFLALSQKNLFEPALPTGAAENGSVGLSNAKPALAYAQLHPHLLKLPTIDECQLIAAQRQSAGSLASGARLKFTRALSLSAHSLSPRAGGSGFGKKLKARLVGAKSSGSLSPSRHSHSYSVSPVYTPPPMRRCATLHHTQPVRKTFKTLQQLERQKRQSSASQATTQPQLQRIVGTNKTYWKYGANSTAASIIGQRARLQQQQQLSELESNISDEPNVDLLESEAHDSATETGSCSVPLPPADSNELLRLSMMLTAASSAITGTATAATVAAAAAATGGSMRRYQPQGDAEDDVNAETVAYEAFHRPKSFERALLRGSSLTAQESHNNSHNNSHSPSPSHNRSRAMQSTSSGRIFKSTSLDAAHVSVDVGLPLAVGVACYGHGASLGGATLDDELEQHIKHCSCSCNHMGYGNSMDYQSTLALKLQLTDCRQENILWQKTPMQVSIVST
ncbi:uncharacterized protein LOC117782901 [Drosophila innubila]|uniref:uncharacterized protein LOC117782901 n=1 Tax=Drosophila innubila TaxID=198719 RepID=UPI00148D3ED5|nr:uncharacterized protein LOC117782901 [Drosophila innubila]